MPEPKIVNLVDLNGVARPVPEAQVQHFLDRGWHEETGTEVAGRTVEAAREDMYGGVGGKVSAGIAGAARGATFGLSDVAARTLGGDDMRRQLEGLREHNPGVSLATEIVGGIAPGGAGSLAAKAGARVAGTGGGALKQVARAGAAGATEGAALGAGQGVSELALSDDPLTMERVASVIGSNALFGAATGGAIGVAGKVVERGLARAKDALDEVASRPLGALGSTDDAARAATVDDLAQYRANVKEANPWAAIDGEAALLSKTNNRLRKIMDDPKGLAENPKVALKALREQETAFERTLANREAIATKLGSANKKIAKDLHEELATLPDAINEVTLTGKSASRYGAFADVKVGKVDKVPTIKLTRDEAQDFMTALQSGKVTSHGHDALGKIEGLAQANRQLQAKIEAATARAVAPTQGAAGIAGEMLQGSVFGHVAGAFSGLPVIGPIIGAKAARLASNLVSGKIGAASTEVAARASKAVQTFLDVGHKVGPAAPVIASKVLSNVVFAPSRGSKANKETQSAPAPDLATAFRSRSEELRSHMSPAPDGSQQMRPDARSRMAEQLAPIRAAHPLLADRIETTKARGLEFLASKLPRRPDVGGMPIGPDKWQPSDMEMRTWARYVAAVEDPTGVVERLASGSITPEDVEAIRTVYPELHADITQQIVSQLATLRSNLPYQRRLALSMFSGVAVDPALDPKVLRVLQGSFADEEGSEGGTQAPMPQPAFGSVSKQEPTPAQQRGS